MLTIATIVLAAIVGGVLYRLRGGPLKDWRPDVFGTQLSRAIWAIPTGALMWAATDTPLWMLPALVVSHFCALAFVGTGQYLEDVPLRLPDGLGTLRTSIAAAPIAVTDPILAAAYAASGSAHAALYWLGFRAGGGSQYGEIFVGAWCWAVIAIFWRLNEGTG
jgi:hypothetical protein